jgi:hypothetical protein
VRLTKAQRAVAIAKDVLSQLRKRQNGYVACSGVYIHREALEAMNPDEAKDLRDNLKAMQKGDSCKVCALGSAILSKARLFDKVPCQDILAGEDEIDVEAIREHLHDAFSEAQLDLIESAFEGANMSSGETPRVNASPNAIEAAIEFSQKHDDDKARLRAIMTNIVKNEGVFKP